MMAAETVLITGIAGGLAQLVAWALHRRGRSVVGVDYRRVPQGGVLPTEVEVHRANYNKTRIEDVFRHHRPSVVLHLGRVGNLKEHMGKRFDLNVIGSQKIMTLCLKYEVRQLLVLSTFHIYGAHPLNHTPIYEDEPLRAGTQFPQIADAIQLDNQAMMFAFRFSEIRTTILRPCNVIGPSIRNAMSRFLRHTTLPYLMGFNPMVQFIHERDLVNAILATVGETNHGRGGGLPVGAFNVAGMSAMPWRTALDIAGARKLPIPSSIAHALLSARRMVAPALPPYLINFIKYPCVIGDEAFRRTFSWEPEVDEVESIRSTVH